MYFTGQKEPPSQVNRPTAELQKLLEQMKIFNYYPHKLSFADIQTNAHRDLQSVEDLPWVILNGLLSVNYRARDGVVDQFNKAQVTQRGTEQEEKQPGKRKLGPQRTISKTHLLHPQDILSVLVECCDLFVLQSLFRNLMKCRVAIPFITKNHELLLWCLRNMILEYSKSEGEISECRAVSEKLNIITFIRIGSISQSKSIILNKLIDSTNNTFYNTECPSRQAKRVLANGSVEGVWHLPTPEDPFDPRLLLNLRGDALNNKDMCQVLADISNLVVVMVSIQTLIHGEGLNCLTSTFSSSYPDIIVLLKNQESEEEIEQAINMLADTPKAAEVDFIYGYENEYQKNISELSEELSNAFSDVSSPRLRTIEGLIPICERQGLKVDEQKAEFVTAKTAINLLIKMTQKDDARVIKNQLPLQAELCLELSQLKRTVKKTHSKEGTVVTMEDRERCEKEIRRIQELQRKEFRHRSELIKLLLDVIRENDHHVTQIVLRILKYSLDDKSMFELPHLQKKYHDIKREIRAKGGKLDKDDHSRLVEAGRALAQGSLGVEHLFREIAQIYEAFGATGIIPMDVSNLPSLMASLMLSGTSIELMDGDTSSVALHWLQKIFDCLHKELKKARVLVVAVLGIQSSGKSTLLNAMFGLDFAVSAGRCTKGVYAQLVRIGSANYPFDYVLVLDTEGLRAPELAMFDYHHDNELATFVLGLADISLINFKGENTAEMMDVLPTVVHALIKLRLGQKKDHSRRCMFVHQNLAAVSAKSKTQYQQDKLLDNLDEMTQTAAGMENDMDTKKFNEVIAFDHEKDTCMFPDLLQGHPPNASINPEYSDTVNKVKRSIFDIGKSMSHNTIDEIFLTMKDLWTALLSMDFIFSFRNTIEAKVYDELEQVFCKERFGFEYAMSTWFTSTAIPRLAGCSTEEKIREVCEGLQAEVQKKLTELLNTTTSCVKEFIKRHQHATIAEQWENVKITSLKNVQSKLKTCYNDKLAQEKRCQILGLEDKKVDSDILNQLNRQAQVVAKRFKEDADESDLKKEFDCIWLKALDERNIGLQPPDSSTDVIMMVQEALLSELQKDSAYVPDELISTPLTKPIRCSSIETIFTKIDMKKDYLEVNHKTWEDVKSFFNTSHVIGNANMHIETILSRLANQIKSFQGSQYVDDTFASRIVREVAISLDKFNKDESGNKGFKFNSLFKARLAVRVCRYIIPIIQDKQKDYEDKFGYAKKLENWKFTTWTTFKNCVQQRGQDIVAAEYIASVLKPALKAYIEKEIPNEMQKLMATHFSQKYYLMIAVLDQIVDNGDFDIACKYTRDCVSCCENWFTSYLNTFMFNKTRSQDNKYTSTAKRLLTQHIQYIREAMRQAPPAGTSTEWKESFIRHVQTTLVCNDTLAFCEISNIAHCEKYLEEELCKLEVDLCQVFESETQASVKWDRPVHNEVFVTLWGCTATCPFCREPCTDSDDGHTGMHHRCLMHRPQGLVGVHEIATGKLMTKNCSYYIAAGWYYIPSAGKKYFYRDYKQYHPDWEIMADSTDDSSKYWLYLMCKFKGEWERRHGRCFQTLGSHWQNINEDEAKRSIRASYNLN